PIAAPRFTSPCRSLRFRPGTTTTRIGWRGRLSRDATEAQEAVALAARSRPARRAMRSSLTVGARLPRKGPDRTLDRQTRSTKTVAPSPTSARQPAAPAATSTQDREGRTSASAEPVPKRIPTSVSTAWNAIPVEQVDNVAVRTDALRKDDGDGRRREHPEEDAEPPERQRPHGARDGDEHRQHEHAGRADRRERAAGGPKPVAVLERAREESDP